mgnify:FL=1|jgi:hypothetical protein
MQFDQLVNEILKKDIKVGDNIRNINPDCEHHGTEGKIKKIKRRPEEGSNKVKNKHNIPGNDVEYEVTNDTTNASKGDRLIKSLDQIKKK